MGEARALRRDGEERFLPALARRQAFLLIPPAFLIAHFGSFARATLCPYPYSYLMMRVSYAYDKPLYFIELRTCPGMVNERKPLSFGPSERYLPALKEGETLTFKLLDIGVDVDTEFGQKLQFSLEALNHTTPSSSPVTNYVKPGKYVWNTTCRAAKDLHEYFIDNGMESCDWTFVLKSEEYGYRIKEVA